MAAMTHDLSKKTWGCNYNIQELYDGGMKIDLVGWLSGIKSGDFLILKQQDGTTRYLVDSIRYCGNPEDMWFATASFAPRDN